MSIKTIMILKRVTPRPELALYIDTFWIFEANYGIPVEDSRVVAPNGKAKFIYPYINGLSTTLNGRTTHYDQQDIYFIGIWDKPVIINSKAQITGTIGIELTPNGIHRFTRASLYEVANSIFSFRDIFGPQAGQLMERLANTPDPLVKVHLLQEFLINIVNQTQRSNQLIDHTVKLITSSLGLVEIKDIEKNTGYSKRYIDLLFREYIGLSPKTFASIVRFQSFYRSWANSDDSNFYKDSLHELYYDQAHFIKEFKRFTGYSPKHYANRRNEFGRIFYKNR